MRGIRTALFALAIALVAAPAHGALTAFRFTDLDLRDAHVYFNFLGCRDVTDNLIVGYSWNSDLQASITSDRDSSGDLDRSYLILFDPLDPSGAGGTLRFGSGSCSAPIEATTCAGDGFLAMTVVGYQNSAS
ncbi:MAG: hypothetical protein ABIU54_00245, partial [Candidatus Eisenbacteria bacterium]